MKWLWKLGGRIHEDTGDLYYFFLLGEDRNTDRAIAPDYRIIRVEDFWAGRVA